MSLFPAQGNAAKIIRGCVMLLDGRDTATMTRTGTRVDEWRDQLGSGNKVLTGFAGTGYNPITVSGLFGSQGGVRFSSTFLETAAAFTTMNWSTGWTVLIAGQKTDQTAQYIVSDSTYTVFGTGPNSRLGSGTISNTAYGLPVSTSCVFGARYTGSALRYILDGQLYVTINGTASPGSGAFGKLQIGGLLPGNFGNMDVGMMAIYNVSLTPQEIDMMTRWMYANMKFAAPVAPTWNIVCDGNSLCAGRNSAGTSYTMSSGIIAATGTPTQRDFIVTGLDGIQVSTLTSRAAATVDVLRVPSIVSKRQIIIVWELTNSLAQGAATPTSVYNDIKAYCQARQAAGWGKIVVATCLPRKDAGLRAGFEADRITLNTNITTNAVSEGWCDYVADIGSDATIGQALSPDDATYFDSDKLHMKSAGHAIAKTYITTAVNTVSA